MTTAAIASAKDASATVADSRTPPARSRPAPKPVFAPPMRIQRKCACGGGCADCQAERDDRRVAIQPKLAVNHPGDAYEQEADRTADRIMSLQSGGAAGASPGPIVRATPLVPTSGGLTAPHADDIAPSRDASFPSRGRAPPSAATNRHQPESDEPVTLQRACACGGGASACHCEDEETPVAQRKAAPAPADAELRSVEVLPERLGSGRPLDTATQSLMESGFGYDFSDVRVHTDERADAAAKSVTALAYTVGHDIVFAQGQYAPGTTEGNRLLAHELTHVLQQNPDSSTLDARRALDPHAPSSAPPPMIQRQAGGRLDHGVMTSPVLLQRQQSPFGDAFGDLDEDAEAGGSDDDSDVHLECPTTPTGLGKQTPVPQCSRATYSGLSELGRWHFCLDSDIIVPTENFDELDAMLRDQPASARFIVHGYASPEGGVEYNFNLSCHRANAIATELRERMRKKLALEGKSGDEIEALTRIRIETGSRGPSNEFGGGAAANRVAVVFGQIPQHGVGFEPACDIAPRKLGDVRPEVPCDARTAKLLTEEPDSDQLGRFRFCLDSDVLSEGGAVQIVSFVNRQASSATYVIQGFASDEGDAAYNQRLSCHRALRIAREIMNAGVLPAQIREVSGLGITTRFGDEKPQNRVVLVLAEKGQISNVEEPDADPTGKKDQAVRDAARARLLAGQYRQEADAYISLWTCGRTPTIRQAVKRLSVLLPENRPLTQVAVTVANGTEEGIGPHNVRLSIHALRADNPVECTMGRIVDMAFHHSVIADESLGDALSKADPTTRHAAGLHLIHLAGLGACTGRFASKQGTGLRIQGIDEPLARDPLATAPLPECARPPQSTRLLTPAAGEKQRRAPDFILFSERYVPENGTPHRGTLSTINIKENENGLKEAAAIPGVAQVIPNGDDVTASASATVGLIGDARTFGDYEIGFVLNVLGDLTTADYVTGDQVVHQLPTPIRAAQLAKEPPVPEPWMAASAAKRPDADGVARDIQGSWKLNLDFAPKFSFFAPSNTQRLDHLDFLQRRTNVGIWLIARRLGAPLDRFSIVPLGGRIFQVIQDFDLEPRRVGGDIGPEDTDTPTVEHEHLFGTGSFVANVTSLEPPDIRGAALLNPVASQIDLLRQVRRFRFNRAPADGISEAEFKAIVQTIVDSIQIFGSEADMETNTNAARVPRLGFDFTALDITVRIARSSGRPTGRVVDVKAPRLGDRPLFHLRKALALRLVKTDFLKTGRSIVLSADAVQKLPGDKNVGIIEVHLEPFDKEPDLAFIEKGINVIDDMTEMIVCTRIMAEQKLDPREFGATYWIDREKKLHRQPSNGFQMSKSALNCTFDMQLPCNEHQTGMVIGSVHTHPGCIPPDPANTKMPSPKDMAFSGSGECGFQHYLISTAGVLSYHTRQKVTPRDDVGARVVAKLGSTVCRQPLPEDPEA